MQRLALVLGADAPEVFVLGIRGLRDRDDPILSLNKSQGLLVPSFPSNSKSPVGASINLIA